jgi:hypothetical protein
MGSGSSVANVAEIEQLTRLLQEIQSSRSTYALRDLSDICNNPKYKEELCSHEELGLLATLKDTFEMSKDDHNVCSWIALCLCRLTSDSAPNRLRICSRELAFLPLLMDFLRSTSVATDIANTENVISSSSLTDGVHEYLLSPEVGWLPYLTNKLKTNPNDMMSYWRFNNFVSRMRNDHLLKVIEFKVPDLVLQKLFTFGCNPANWSKAEKDGIIYRIYIFVANFSSIACGRTYLKEYLDKDPQYSSHFISLLDSPDVIGILSTIIIANVYGRDENNQTTKSLLNEHKEILSRLIDVLDVSLNYDVKRPVVIDLINKGFTYGPIKLHVLTSSIRNLSVSDENKNIMIKYSKLIELACQEISSFIMNFKEFSGVPPGQSFANSTGGGGNDLLTLENTMELILQLSFVSEDENILNFTFTNPHYNVKELMEKMIALPMSRNLPYEVRQFALQFLARLQPKKKLVEEPMKKISETVGSGKEKKSDVTVNMIPKHIMLSYSWSANKHLVIAIGQRLREKGYDVWRDEDGSSIMSPMSGDIVETMGSAVDKSYAVIIFVSPEYKESANCRQEAGYARARATNSGIKLIYVMMNENYHTRSSPRQVDGWLGFMIGSELWYPLFNESFIESTVSALVGLMGDNAKRGSNALQSSIAPAMNNSTGNVTSGKSLGGGAAPAPAPSFAAVPATVPADADFVVAFSILLPPKKSICPEGWSGFLKGLGLEEAEDLKDFEARKLVALAEFLKPVPSTEFLKALRL